MSAIEGIFDFELSTSPDSVGTPPQDPNALVTRTDTLTKEVIFTQDRNNPSPSSLSAVPLRKRVDTLPKTPAKQIPHPDCDAEFEWYSPPLAQVLSPSHLTAELIKCGMVTPVRNTPD
jgi:hypothetical protein